MEWPRIELGAHHVMSDRPDALLRFWFGEPGAPPLAHAGRWFKPDPAFDAQARQLFGSDLEAASRGELDPWRDSARGCLAFIVLTDQLSRNIHRGAAQAFATDGIALAASEGGQVRGLDAQLTPVERWFFYLPLMHAEDLVLQRRSVALFESLGEGAPEPLLGALRGAHKFAIAHLRIIERFGRFPHRNALLGRPSTPEELAFLTEPGSSF
jgi:uncharacterized protein (DUF924 family)